MFTCSIGSEVDGHVPLVSCLRLIFLLIPQKNAPFLVLDSALFIKRLLHSRWSLGTSQKPRAQTSNGGKERKREIPLFSQEETPSLLWGPLLLTDGWVKGGGVL